MDGRRMHAHECEMHLLLTENNVGGVDHTVVRSLVIGVEET